jgi:hypothetical protein
MLVCRKKDCACGESQLGSCCWRLWFCSAEKVPTLVQNSSMRYQTEKWYNSWAGAPATTAWLQQGMMALRLCESVKAWMRVRWFLMVMKMGAMFRPLQLCTPSCVQQMPHSLSVCTMLGACCLGFLLRRCAFALGNKFWTDVRCNACVQQYNILLVPYSLCLLILTIIKQCPTEWIVQSERSALSMKLAASIVSGFFQHKHWCMDLGSHGLLQLHALMIAAGLPYGPHLQRKLATQKYKLALALLHLGVPDAHLFVFRCGVERLLVDDAHFRESFTGKQCMNVIRCRDRTQSLWGAASLMDQMPYHSDGYITSVGHTRTPMSQEELFQLAEASTFGLYDRRADLTSLLEFDSAPPDADRVASLLQRQKAGGIQTVDWLKVADAIESSKGAEAGDAQDNWDPQDLLLGLLPHDLLEPSEMIRQGSPPAAQLVRAVREISLAQKMIQAVSPE